jgi:hypothetical protein
LSDKYLFIIIALLLVAVTACDTGKPGMKSFHFSKKNREVPNFNADSTYQEIVRQVQMGSRNPGSQGHKQALAYLANKLKSYAGARDVYVQKFSHKGYNGRSLHFANIIAAFNPRDSDRIMLCAHWDTRPRADEDSVNTNQPILGADDGASGVAVLLELARLFHQKTPPIGVDIILFDGEDYGKEQDINNYFLGSKYWAKHPPVKNYHPRFGLLLDMVGGIHARFPKEGYSMNKVPSLVNAIWKVARQMGYDSLFVDKKGEFISDDHVPIIHIRKIPVIDIINYSPGKSGNAAFPPYWHTHRDNLKIISKKTLEGVGKILTEIIYNRLS